jgi:hypothetical protein
VHDKASLRGLPLEDTVPPAVLEVRAARKTTAQVATARHVGDALRALGYGHGIQWAADITALPLRFVASVARARGMTKAAGGEHDGCPVVQPDDRLPGRCGVCGYLETAPGHEVTCESGRASAPGRGALAERGQGGGR